MESILTSIKKMLGIAEEYVHFDPDIILCINSALSILTQLGVGPEEGFAIRNAAPTWMDFIGDDLRIEMVKSYMHLKVRLLFDPPVGAALLAAMERQVSELEWRLNVAVDPEEGG